MTRFLAILFLATACHGQTNAPLVGCDAASGTDSGEEIPIFGIIQPQIVRTRADGWAAMEPTKGVYNWTRFDNMLMLNTKTSIVVYASNLASLSNMVQPIMVFNVYGPPAFYTNQQDYITGETNYVAAILHRAPHRIQVIEFVNEPWFDWLPQCVTWQDAAAFTARLAIAVRVAVHSIDPTVLIAGPSLSIPDSGFYSVFAAWGGFWACDIVTFHDYRMSGLNSQSLTYTPYETYGPSIPNLAGCKADADSYSGGKPVYISEIGLGTYTNTISYCIEAGRVGIWAINATYFLGTATNLWQCNYWTTNGIPKPNGSAFLATLRAEQTP
jgi:hypothetical protein